MRSSTMTRKFAALATALGLSLQGCGLEKVEVPASLTGPSELGISIRMLAIPDIVLADGIQTAAIQAVVQDQNGQRVPNRAVVFLILDESGNIAEIGTLTSSTGARVYGSTTVNTNAQGIAQVIYTTPERRDFTANARLLIGARLVGSDANGAPYTTVRIELRSAEPRRFPEGGTSAPTCSFNQAPNNPIVKEGSVLRFSSTSSAAGGYIIRYEYYFGDGTSSDGGEGHIDVQKPYPFAGTYTVTHIVTANSGISSSCSKTITVVP